MNLGWLVFSPMICAFLALIVYAVSGNLDLSSIPTSWIVGAGVFFFLLVVLPNTLGKWFAETEQETAELIDSNDAPLKGVSFAQAKDKSGRVAYIFKDTTTGYEYGVSTNDSHGAYSVRLKNGKPAGPKTYLPAKTYYWYNPSEELAKYLKAEILRDREARKKRR